MRNTNPHNWTEAKIVAAFRYFTDHYHGGGIFEDVFAGQPPVTRDEFMRAVLEDYDAAMRGETVHPLLGSTQEPIWEWASVERESVRDRVLTSRGLPVIGYFGDRDWEDGRFGASVGVGVGAG